MHVQEHKTSQTINRSKTSICSCKCCTRLCIYTDFDETIEQTLEKPKYIQVRDFWTSAPTQSCAPSTSKTTKIYAFSSARKLLKRNDDGYATECFGKYEIKTNNKISQLKNIDIGWVFVVVAYVCVYTSHRRRHRLQHSRAWCTARARVWNSFQFPNSSPLECVCERRTRHWCKSLGCVRVHVCVPECVDANSQWIRRLQHGVSSLRKLL